MSGASVNILGIFILKRSLTKAASFFDLWTRIEHCQGGISLKFFSFALHFPSSTRVIIYEFFTENLLSGLYPDIKINLQTYACTCTCISVEFVASLFQGPQRGRAWGTSPPPPTFFLQCWFLLNPSPLPSHLTRHTSVILTKT